MKHPILSPMAALLMLGSIPPLAHAGSDTDMILGYAESRTFTGYPLMRNAQLEVMDGEAALANKHVEGETLDKQRKRFDAEELADIHDEIGFGYDAMGADFLALVESSRARALTSHPDKYDANIAADYMALGRYDDAEKFFKELLEKRPDDYFGRRKYGLFLLERGRYSESRDQLLQLLKQPDLEPHDRAYTLIYFYLAAKGAGADPRSALQPYLGDISGVKWPIPLALFFAGQKSETDLLHYLQQDKAEQADICEVLFYLGRDTELGGDKQKAISFYQQALRTNYVGFSEYHAAGERLRVLLTPGAR